MPHRRPSLLAAPPSAAGRLWLSGARLFDGRGVTEAAGVLVSDGRIERVGSATDTVPEGALAIDLAGRTLMPGLIDAHVHLRAPELEVMHGAEPLWPQTPGLFVASALTRLLRMGFTTVRDVGSYGDEVVAARQAMRYGAFRGPRVLTCGQIVSATAPGHRFFAGCTGRPTVLTTSAAPCREQLRKGADFIKVMSTGARSVELRTPIQLSSQLRRCGRWSRRRTGGIPHRCPRRGTGWNELSIRAGIDTIEHGMYLNQRPDLLDAMAQPTRSWCRPCRASMGSPDPAPAAVSRIRLRARRPGCQLLADLAQYNLEQAGLTLQAARNAGVTIAMGYDWSAAWHQRARARAHGPPWTRPTAGSDRRRPPAGPKPRSGRSGGSVEPGKLGDLW